MRCIISKVSGTMKKSSFIEALKIILKIILKNFGLYFVSTIIISVCHSLLMVGNIYQSQRFFEAIEVTINKNNINYKFILINLAILCGILILSVVINGVHNYMFDALMKKVEGKLQYEIHLKCKKIAPISYENTETLDMIYKASQGMKSSFNLVMTTIFIFTFYIPYLIFLGFYLFNLDKFLIISLLVIFLPVIISQFIRNKVYSDLFNTVAPKKRQSDYFSKCASTREYFKETRLLQAESFFLKKFKETFHEANELSWIAKKKMGLIELLSNLLNTAGYILVIVMLVNLLLEKRITVGAFAAVFASIDNTYGILYELVDRQIANIIECWGSVKNYIKFLYYPEMDDDLNVNRSINGDIILDDVTFQYPNVNRVALKNINIQIHKGETVAIVGTNGSGKSTLSKIICGIYSPTNGKALYERNGSAVFQNFQKYKLTLKENICIADTDKNTSEQYIHDILGNLEFDEGIIENDLEINLSNEFGGIDLSGGQWQKIAIARGLFRESDLIILDEPTSAIDPIEESKMYERFSQITKNKTAILITHRLASAKIADRIFVLDNGELAEVGTHDELINKNGLYNKLFMLQAHWYN